MASAFETIPDALLAHANGGYGPKLQAAATRANELGLYVKNGPGAKAACDDAGRYILVGGSPTPLRTYHDEMKQTQPRVLKYNQNARLQVGY